MLPVIALIGRPNVGKSTLFNRLTRSRDALVADYPGLTRDRKYGFGKLGPIPYLVIDTGGVAGGEIGIDERMAEQTVRALGEADAAIVLVDAREGLTSADQHAAELARRHVEQLAERAMEVGQRHESAGDRNFRQGLVGLLQQLTRTGEAQLQVVTRRRGLYVPTEKPLQVAP